jgi:hypothetical protein
MKKFLQANQVQNMVHFLVLDGHLILLITTESDFLLSAKSMNP